MHNELCERLGIEFPIFAFSHCRDVVAAVTNAGGIGVLGALAFSPEQLELELKWIDEHVNGKSYGVDVVIPASHVGSGFEDAGALLPKLQEMVPRGDDRVDRRRPRRARRAAAARGRRRRRGRERRRRRRARRLGAARLDQRDVEAAGRGRRSRTTSSCSPTRSARRRRTSSTPRTSTASWSPRSSAGPTRPASRSSKASTSSIAQGTEAGGHTGEIATMVLVPEVVEAVAPTPVLAAGGIGSGRQMAAAMALGAAGVWTGSIWLGVAESNTGPEGHGASVRGDRARRGAFPLAHRQARAHAAHRVDGGVGARRLPGHAADAAAVHGDAGSARPHRPLRPSRPVRHAGRPDRRQHGPRADVEAGRPRHGAGVHRHRREDGGRPRRD